MKMNESILVVSALAAVVVLGAGPARAGDAAAGEKVWKKCFACHTIDGGKSKKMGPDLKGVVGRKAGAVDHKYTDGFMKLVATGMVWDDANLDAYLIDPTKFVQEKSGDPAGTSKMALKIPNEKDRADVIAYLKTQ